MTIVRTWVVLGLGCLCISEGCRVGLVWSKGQGLDASVTVPWMQA